MCVLGHTSSVPSERTLGVAGRRQLSWIGFLGSFLIRDRRCWRVGIMPRISSSRPQPCSRSPSSSMVRDQAGERAACRAQERPVERRTDVRRRSLGAGVWWAAMKDT